MRGGKHVKLPVCVAALVDLAGHISTMSVAAVLDFLSMHLPVVSHCTHLSSSDHRNNISCFCG